MKRSICMYIYNNIFHFKRYYSSLRYLLVVVSFNRSRLRLLVARCKMSIKASLSLFAGPPTRRRRPPSAGVWHGHCCSRDPVQVLAFHLLEERTTPKARRTRGVKAATSAPSVDSNGSQGLTTTTSLYENLRTLLPSASARLDVWTMVVDADRPLDSSS